MKEKESFVPIEDIADHFAVSVSTIRAWVRRKHITPDAYIKVGSTYRFRISDVTNSLLSNGAMVGHDDVSESTVLRGAQKHAEDSVASYMERKEAATPTEVEELFDEDM